MRPLETLAFLTEFTFSPSCAASDALSVPFCDIVCSRVRESARPETTAENVVKKCAVQAVTSTLAGRFAQAIFEIKLLASEPPLACGLRTLTHQ